MPSLINKATTHQYFHQLYSPYPHPSIGYSVLLSIFPSTSYHSLHACLKKILLLFLIGPNLEQIAGGINAIGDLKLSFSRFYLCRYVVTVRTQVGRKWLRWNIDQLLRTLGIKSLTFPRELQGSFVVNAVHRIVGQTNTVNSRMGVACKNERTVDYWEMDYHFWSHLGSSMIVDDLISLDGLK